MYQWTNICCKRNASDRKTAPPTMCISLVYGKYNFKYKPKPNTNTNSNTNKKTNTNTNTIVASDRKTAPPTICISLTGVLFKPKNTNENENKHIKLNSNENNQIKLANKKTFQHIWDFQFSSLKKNIFFDIPFKSLYRIGWGVCYVVQPILCF